MNKTLKQRLASDTPVLMVNPNHISPTLCEKLVRSGADAVFIDCEHGLASHEDIHHMAKAARYGGGFGIVRPQNQERSTITRCLNAGADGLMVPLIHTSDIAREVVHHFRYAVPDEHVHRLLIGMVESVEAVQNLDAILAVDGIDVFFVGPGPWATRPTCRPVAAVRRRCWTWWTPRCAAFAPRASSLARWRSNRMWAIWWPRAPS
jgi:2-keto-3-deoxy-L-rhamnonate aldolase RhmA